MTVLESETSRRRCLSGFSASTLTFGAPALYDTVDDTTFAFPHISGSICIVLVPGRVLSEISLRYIPEGGCWEDNEISPCLVSMPEIEVITPVVWLSRTCLVNWDSPCSIKLLYGPPAKVIPPVMVPGLLPNSNASRWSLTAIGKQL